MSAPAVGINVENQSVVIGHYRLLQKIGEGGFGSVYMADQLKPVTRRVALKIIKPGMDTRQVIARFEAERQALAMMDHPNIARVLDGGETDEGRPYFVMELVKGIPITEYCKQEKLSMEARLRLFTDVCRAVQHAHSKGIIHRDIKPSNIMVTVKDGEPVPKVIDFGIAKATEHRLTDKTLFTRYEHMIGTPTYMSPEQAALSGADVDTRCDIYALGVLLYELLTTTTPFDAKTLQSAAFDEMRRIIREVDPPRPSTRVTQLRKEFERSDAQVSTSAIKSDLDWIVMKCLEKDRNRRYETANGLAMDIERHLSNEPVMARPPSSWYRVQKFAKRNKLAFASAAIVSVALLIGITASLWGLLEANKQRLIAQSESNEAREARAEAEEARIKADAEATRQARQVYLRRLGAADQAILARLYPRAQSELNECSEDQRGWEWDLLNHRVSDTITSELAGSERPFFTSDGSRIVTLGRGRTPEARSVIVWEVSTGRSVEVFPCEKELMSLALSPNDNWLAVGDIDGNLLLWNFKTHEKVWTKSEAPREGFNGMSGSHDGTRVGLAFSPDEKRIASANFTNTLKVFDTETGEVTFSVKLKSLIRKVMFSPDGRWIAVGNGGSFNPENDGIFVPEEHRAVALSWFQDEELSDTSPSVLVDTRTGRIIEFSPGSKVPTFSPDGSQIATGDPWNGTITLWDWDGSKLKRKKSWRSAVSTRFFDLCYMPDGKHLVSTKGTHAWVWQLEEGKLTAHVNYSWGDWLAVSPDRKTIAFSGGRFEASRIHLWEWMSPSARMKIDLLKKPNQLLRFSPDGTKVAMGSHSGQQAQSALETAGRVIIADAKSGDQIGEINNPCRGFSWMPDSQQLVVARDDEKTHEIYDLATHKLVRKFTSNSTIGRPYIDQTGQILTSVGRDREEVVVIQQWDVKSTQLMGSLALGGDLSHQPGAVRQIAGGFWNAAVGPSGHFVAVFGGRGEVRQWDIRNKVELSRWAANSMDTLAFTNDGQSIYTSGGDRFGLYDAESSQVIDEFNGPAGAVAVSPDKKHVVSCGNGVVIWDIKGHLPLVTLSEAGERDFISVDWSPDHKRIAAGRDDGSVYVWTLPVIE